MANLGVSLHSPVLYSPVSRILNTTQVVHTVVLLSLVSVTLDQIQSE